MAYIAGVNRPVETGDTYFNEISKHIDRIILKKLEVSGIVKARIEYARYIVDCPNCNSAEFAFEDNLFFCSQCNNSDIQGKVRQVKMPKDRKQIEEVLGKRPIKNRHWLSTESVKDLQNENLKMGVI